MDDTAKLVHTTEENDEHRTETPEDKTNPEDKSEAVAGESADTLYGNLGSNANELTYELTWKDGHTEYLTAGLIVGPAGELCFWNWDKGARTVQLVVNAGAYERCRRTHPL